MYSLSAVNDPPVISSLPIPETIFIIENTPLSTTLYHVIAEDSNTADTVVIDVEYGPTSGSSYFDVSSCKLNVYTAYLSYFQLKTPYDIIIYMYA